MARASDKLDNLVDPISNDVHRAITSRIGYRRPLCHVGTNSGIRFQVAVIVEPMTIFKWRYLAWLNKAIAQQLIDIQIEPKL
jgi:hypothetical protein